MYRGVVLDKTIMKFLTGIINKRLISRLEQAIPENQLGFTQGKLALQALEVLTDLIDESLSQPKRKYFAVFIDHSKAFDLLDRTIMVKKLRDLTEEKIRSQN